MNFLVSVLGLGMPFFIVFILSSTCFNFKLTAQTQRKLAHLKRQIFEYKYRSNLDLELNYIGNIAKRPSRTVINELASLRSVYMHVFDFFNTPYYEGGDYYHQQEEALMGSFGKNKNLEGHYIRAGFETNNIQPSLLIPNPESKNIYSDDVKEYLEQESVSKFTLSSDKFGKRTTLPKVSSEKKIWVIGDSVAFGEGIGDKDTLASFLQRDLMDKYEVYNLGVAGLDTENILETFERAFGFESDLDYLVYIMCENDFHEDPALQISAETELRKIERKFKKLNINVKKIFILPVYNITHVSPYFINSVASAKKNSQVRSSFIKSVNELSKRDNRYEFVSSMEVFSKFDQDIKTYYSMLSYYVDTHHLSGLGNKILAQEIRRRIEKE